MLRDDLNEAHEWEVGGICRRDRRESRMKATT
jgi:hypothetical protein